jgi:hypothetical protein
VSGQDLRAECDLIERAVLGASLATEDEIAPWRPGGEKNPRTDAPAWLKFLTRLHRFHARGESRHVDSPRALHDAEVLDALRSQPVPVVLLSHAVTDHPVNVYPKSMEALLQVYSLDLRLAWMTEQRKLLLERATAEDINLLPEVDATIAYTYQLLAWIVVTPGPESPFKVDELNPVPPDWIRALEPWDILSICEAHQRHLLRLSALTHLIDDKKAEKGKAGRPSWSVFFGAMAVELGTSAETLVKHRALAALLAEVQLGNYVRTPDDDAST